MSTTSNLGRVQGGGFFGSTSTSTTSILKTTVQIGEVSPLAGDTIVNANGDVCKITAITSTAYTVTKYGSIKGAAGSSGANGLTQTEADALYAAKSHSHSEYTTHAEVSQMIDTYIAGGGGGGGGGCLLEGTLIRMADGTDKPIEEVAPGDRVASLNVLTNENCKAIVLRRPLVGITTSCTTHLFGDDVSLYVYPDHHMYCIEDEYPKNLSQWEIGQHTFDLDGNEVEYGGSYELTSLGSVKYYTLVTSNNLYFADGILSGHTGRAKSLHTKYLDLPASVKEIYQLDAQEYDNVYKYRYRNHSYEKASRSLHKRIALNERTARKTNALIEASGISGDIQLLSASALSERKSLTETLSAAKTAIESATTELRALHKQYKPTADKREMFRACIERDFKAQKLLEEALAAGTFRFPTLLL